MRNPEIADLFIQLQNFVVQLANISSAGGVTGSGDVSLGGLVYALNDGGGT